MEQLFSKTANLRRRFEVQRLFRHRVHIVSVHFFARFQVKSSSFIVRERSETVGAFFSSVFVCAKTETEQTAHSTSKPAINMWVDLRTSCETCRHKISPKFGLIVCRCVGQTDYLTT